jgi:ATP-dependent exoDNAse (exonuclease V) alpha subunit
MTNEIMQLSEQQKEVVERFESGKNIFVTGGAGSGKSYLLNYLKRNYAKLGFEVAASTGVAALNVGGSTIHSWAGIGLANLPPEQIVDNLLSPRSTKARNRIRRTQALAIDEVSMLSIEVLDILNYVFQQVRQNNQPMGGMQILFFGDFLQLPPVNRNSSQSNFCFNADSWKDLDLEGFVLEKIFRQSDEKFVKILNNLRFGELDEDDVEALQSRVNAKDNSSAIKPTILTTHNMKVEKINQVALQHIPRDETSFEAKYFGLPNKIDFLKRNCIASQLLKLKVGAQVMMIKNTYQKEGVINGSLGIVREFSAKKSYPVVEFAGNKLLTISPEEWLVERFDDKKKVVITDAGMSQIPLILAWAMTIHKSQGLTLDKISCDLSDVFSPGQAYVALSRARSLDGVFIEAINFNKIRADNAAIDFYRGLK